MSILPELASSVTETNDKIEEVNKFQYLGSVLTSNCSLDAEIDARLSKAAEAFGSLSRLVRYQSKIQKDTKMRLLKSLILLVLFYGSKSWAPLSHHIQTFTKIFNQIYTDYIRNFFAAETKFQAAKNCSIWTNHRL